MSVPPHFLVPVYRDTDQNASQHNAEVSHKLPFELVEALNQTYFLHLLVTQPDKVIPPGKSLLSMMTHANYTASDEIHDGSDQARHQQIEKKVKEVAHRAFWNEAMEHLLSPLPSVQLPRLKQLYLDLHEALVPLFPPGHRILISLSSPLPPTSSPLHSTVILLKEIVSALRERCAPVRDGAADNLATSLDSAPAGSAESHAELAKFVLDSMKRILELAEDMRRDLNTFVLGAISESQLKGVLARDVKKRERDLVVKTWGGQDNVRRAWREWVWQLSDAEESETKWLKRLFLALGNDKPVYCDTPAVGLADAEGSESASQTIHVQNQSANVHSTDGPISGTSEPPLQRLPPQLLFFTPTLLFLQNYIQAIVIAGALRALTRLPASTTSASDFMQRVWTLIETEIEGDVPEIRHTQGIDAGAGQTKVVNLVDEVLRVRQLVSGATIKSEEETELRLTVERTLRANDPVFLLLRRRLLKAMEDRILASVQEPTNVASGSNAGIPIKMQTGKDLGGRAGKRIRLMLPDASDPTTRVDDAKLEGPPIPGFEDPVLQRVIREAIDKIMDIVLWTTGVWGDLV